MHPDVVAIWAKTKGRGHLCTLDTCLISLSVTIVFPIVSDLSGLTIQHAGKYHASLVVPYM